MPAQRPEATEIIASKESNARLAACSTPETVRSFVRPYASKTTMGKCRSSHKALEAKHLRQRRYAFQPRVARKELPWEPSKKRIQPQRGLRPGSAFGGTALRFDPLWFSPQGRPAAGQPWAGGRNPVGIFRIPLGYGRPAITEKFRYLGPAPCVPLSIVEILGFANPSI